VHKDDFLAEEDLLVIFLVDQGVVLVSLCFQTFLVVLGTLLDVLVVNFETAFGE
jgi:hypothetical protein